MTRERRPDPDLAWLVDVLWSDAVVGRATPGATGYVVVPGAHGARAILPADRAAARAALLAAGGTRSRAAQRGRAVVAQATRTGLLRPRLFVRGNDPLRATIETALGECVHLACAVRAPAPFRKPVVQVVGAGGVIAYAKVAWNAVTAANVAAEHRALLGLAGVAASALAGPEPIALLEHH